MTDTYMNGVKKEEEEEEEDIFWDSEGDESEEDSGRRPALTKKTMLHMGEALMAPIPTRYSCEALVKMIDNGAIDLEPEYQRGVVWNEAKQSAVIDSIFRNYYVPPVLFSIHTITNEEGDKEDLRICVDGKQRLSSIHAFMKNKIPLKETNTMRSFWYKYQPKQRRVLTDRQREKFAQIQINCIEYTGLDEERERDMFQRVQMGVTLTPAEKLSANLGPWPEFLRELVKRYVENEEMNLRHVIKMDRGKDFMYMGMITLLITHCNLKNFTPNSHTLAKFLKMNAAPAETQKKQIIAALAKLTALSNDDANNAPLLPLILPRRAPKAIAPIEFLFAGYICFRFSLATNKQLSELIQGLLQRARSEHIDVMINSKVESTLRNYIREMESLHPFWMSAETSAGSRKRPRESDQDADEWVPTMDRISSIRDQSDYAG